MTTLQHLYRFYGVIFPGFTGLRERKFSSFPLSLSFPCFSSHNPLLNTGFQSGWLSDDSAATGILKHSDS